MCCVPLSWTDRSTLVAQLRDIPSWWQLCSLWSCGWVSPGFLESCASNGEVTLSPPLGSRGRSWSLHGAWGAFLAEPPPASLGPHLGHVQQVGNCVHSRWFHLTTPHFVKQVPPCTAYPDLAKNSQRRQLSGP